MTEVIAVAVITFLAVISPGADFAMVVRNSYLYGRPTGLFAAAGVAAGVLVHVSYRMLGVGLLIASSAGLFTVIKLAGAAYLVWIGIRTFRARAEVAVDLEEKGGMTPLGALRSGFLTNVLNPKTTLFDSRLRDRMLKAQKALNRAIGSVLVGLGVGLGFAR
ncbi:LysE family translocator [Streptomyces sp. NPDC003952]